ncbi:MAG TPA: DNA polymerase, partial [Candidatus Hodarchaeales archaeon]|nr:DNA polymerase [Candidatus Hodarchaeales archaeon]
FPEYKTRPLNLLVRPSFKDAIDALNGLHACSSDGHIAVDIETRLRHIACIGFATSISDAICIPFMCTERTQGYWTIEEETSLIHKIKEVLQHPATRVIGQNFIYDMQYIVRRWGFIFPVHADTMLTQHAIFPGRQKDLAYISSLYSSDYCYWKDEGKDWNPAMDEDQLWGYNCKDAIYTLEDHLAQDIVLDKYSLQTQASFLQDLFEPVLFMMLRGTAIDMPIRSKMGMELLEAMNSREAWFTRVMPIKLAKSKGAKPWYRSTKQQKTLFYDLMQLPIVKNKKTGKPTVDDQALEKFMTRQPLLIPLIRKMQEYRSLGVFYNTFISAELEHDNRIRCSYNIGGTETFRFSSSEDAFGYGTNLQNVPRGTEE